MIGTIINLNSDKLKTKYGDNYIKIYQDLDSTIKDSFQGIKMVEGFYVFTDGPEALRYVYYLVKTIKDKEYRDCISIFKIFKIEDMSDFSNETRK